MDGDGPGIRGNGRHGGAAARPPRRRAETPQRREAQPPMPRPRRRVLLVFPQALTLGQYFAPLVRAAAERFEVHVAVPPAPGLEAFDLGRVALHALPATRRGLPAALGEVRYAAAIRRLIGRLRPDLLHAVSLRPAIHGGIAARFFRVPASVLSVADLGVLARDTAGARLMRPAGELALRFALGRGATAIFENAADRDHVVGRRLIDPQRTRVFPGAGVDTAAFSFTPEPMSGPPLVVLPGRLIAEKGIREFVAAARMIARKGLPARFALVGDVDFSNPTSLEREEIDQWVREGAVEWWGWREDMAGTLRQAAVVCLPSYSREGAPRSLIEAAAVGRPAVTTDMPGCRDIVVAGETGLIVPPRNPPALASALHRLIADRGLRARMGMAARVRAEALFSLEVAVGRTLALYDEALRQV